MFAEESVNIKRRLEEKNTHFSLGSSFGQEARHLWNEKQGIKLYEVTEARIIPGIYPVPILLPEEKLYHRNPFQICTTQGLVDKLKL